ncbi:hypothetical protein jhhlp_007117 [Lomentospora prolificans]|uniref:Aminotransferase class I/classII large domain-containing protein n=1 Tax=Lomentospora prolificans TaxID=41688 RepID=A0A2N3N1R1_9PEZI|nr:hypothetical protein jhhlp_007117 [Lomentospora prolificans]
MEPYASRIKDVLERRARAGRFAPGVAAYSDSDMFKKPPTSDMPMAKRWDNHFSEECKARRPCILKQAAKYLKTPGLISLGGGLPSANYFPFDSLTVTVPPRPDFNLPHASAQDSPAPPSSLSINKDDIPTNKGDYDLSVALNYGQVAGSAQMLRFVTELTEILYAPPYADWWCTQTTGSTGALETVARMFCDKARGDNILMEEYTFSTAQETMEALKIGVAGVKMDGEGIVPGELRRLLEEWDEAAKGRKPHVLYTVPTGQNPTGASLSKGRRREIYEICEDHDIFIVEDDPYYLLQMADYTPGSHNERSTGSRLESYMASLPGTFLSIDTSGRVLRLDSFSKILSPGSRMGWVTGSAQVVERFLRHCESSQGPSGFSQAALYTLLEGAWGGHQGFLEWVAALGTEYEVRRNVLLKACEDFLPGVAKWTIPKAGMFLWIKLDHTKHPRHAAGVPALEEEIFQSCISKGVLVARGSWFRATGSGSHSGSSGVNESNGLDIDGAGSKAVNGCDPKTVVNGYQHGEEDKPSELFFRTTFATATVEGMREAMKRFGEAIRESFEIDE